MNIPYWAYQSILHTRIGHPWVEHFSEALYRHTMVFGTIPIFMILGYFWDKTAILDRRLREYSGVLEDRVKERTRELEMSMSEFKGLYELSDLFREAVELKRMCGVVAGKIAELMDVERCCVILYDSETLEFTAPSPAYGMRKEELKRLRFPMEDAAPLFEHWEEKDPLLSNNPGKDERLMSGLMGKFKERNLLLAKLLVAGEFLGILRLANKRSGNFTSDDARLVEIIASRFGAALHTLKLFKELHDSEEKVRERAQELEHSNQLKDLFTDIMRHDLQNPVTVIKGLSGILGEDEIPRNLKQGLERIRKNAEKLEEMIETASKYAKLENTEDMDFLELDLNETLKEVIRGFKPLLDEKKMRLSYKDGRSIPVTVNPMIEDVFANLLSNAIKYSPEKTRITVGIEDEGESWRVYVTDRGDGIPDDGKEAVFNRFTRADKRGVKGTGLGLAIVKRIVDLHKGKVWVEDNPDGGSIFYVQLPKEE